MAVDTDDRAVGGGVLWFGFLGGGVAWMVHLLAVWLIAEFGCVLAVGRVGDAVISTTAVLLLVATAICLTGAIGATVVARRLSDRLDADDEKSHDRASRFLARGGVVMSGLFSGIVLFQSIPIYFFLDHC